MQQIGEGGKGGGKGGGHNEILFREEVVELTADVRDALHGLNNVNVNFVFDRQVRPHLILTCRQLDGNTLGRRKPSYWDLPIQLQATLLEHQTRIATELSALRSEVHLGTWVSSAHIHAHIVLPLLPYFALRAAAQGEECYGKDVVEGRARYVEKTARENDEFKMKDEPEAKKAVTSGEPQRLANLASFEALSFDAEETGAPTIDITFKGAPLIKSMSHAELCQALEAVKGLCDALLIDGAHLLWPAPALGDGSQLTGEHQERRARLVVRPDLFVLSLPPDRRQAWYDKWSQGGHLRANAYKEDVSLLPIAAEDQERTAIKFEASTMDTKSLMERNAELMRKLSAGTATRAETTKLEATMAAIEKAKADADAMRTIEARDELIRRNEALMAKVKAGTATRADKEKADLSTLEIKRRKSTEESIAKETEVGELLRRNAALMKTMKEGTATRADREELEAVMRRKEELDKELGETKARETKAKLDAARGELRLTERKTAVRDVMRMIKESERTDLCFMIDATGSMGKHIEAVKTQIVKIATDVQKTNPHLQLRVAITGYRDRVDCPTDKNSPFDFTDSLETFVSNVSSISADGGGDGCEDVSSGISDVLRFSWSSPTRVLFFIADAPSHGARYHDGCNDNHTSGDHGIPEKLKKLVAMNIDIVFCSINDSITAKMIRVMNSDLGGSPIKTVPLGDPSALTTHATATLRK